MADHVCPVWVGYLLASPVRKLICNPASIVGPYLRDGMTVMDVGCAMGFFSIPMARMVGAGGKVVCLDIQEKMLEKLDKKAVKAGVEDIIESRLCEGSDLGIGDLSGQVDFALAFAMVHEADGPEGLIHQLYDSMKDGGRLLIAEPKGHVKPEMFEDTLRWAGDAGFRAVGSLPISRNYTVLLEKAA